MTNAAKNSLPLCLTSQNVLSQEEHILIHILLEQALLNIFSFSSLSCRSRTTIFLASPPNNVLTPRMSQGHINIQILSSIWIKHCNVWMVLDRQTDRHTDRQTDRHTDRQTNRHTDRQTDTLTDKQTNSKSCHSLLTNNTQCTSVSLC